MEHGQTQEMQEHLRKRMRDVQSRDAGRMDSVRAGVLSLVVSESYDRAINELRGYVRGRTDFPNFQDRAERYVEHCCDLIQAVQAKRNFPGLSTLSMSKQQELHEKVLEHFDELKQNLKYVEKIEREHKMSDVRSTVWVVYALSAVGFAILAAAFIVDARAGMLTSAAHEAADLFDEAGDWFVNHLPFL